MTDVADRHWGTSLVRAPTAKDAAHPDRPAEVPPVAALPESRTRAPRSAPTFLRSTPGGSFALAGTTPPPAPAVTAPTVTAPAVPVPPVSLAAPAPSDAECRPPSPAAAAALVAALLPPPPPAPVMPALPPILAARQPLPTVSDRARSAPAPAVLPWPVTTPADPGPSAAGSSAAELTESAPSDHALARLARGVQDCARALACLADRLDGLEHRLDAVATATTHPVGGGPSSSSSSSPETEPLDVRVRTLEGMAADRLQAVDQRLRRLEILPVAVGRLQQDTARLSELARAKLLDNGAGDLTSVYQELDSVAELVAAHHGAATQSLERVRTLERAVLEMGRHLDRRLTAAELAPRSIEP